MDIEALKGKTLDADTHEGLVKFIAEFEGKVAQAREESIKHRKGLKAQLEELERVNRLTFEKLGIESSEDLEALPDAKGQAEALKQFEAKLKRTERERDEAKSVAIKATQERDSERRSGAIARAITKHQFVDPDIAAMLLEHGARMSEDGKIEFEAEGGKLVPLDEGAAWIAKSKPHLVKAQGGTGSGYRQNGNGGAGGQKTMTRAEFEALGPLDRAKAMREKTALTD